MSNPETETVARLLARGYNRHIKEHGPDGSYAGDATETAGGHGLIVSRGGAEFAVRVERAQAMAEPGPLTPGQCWAALREKVTYQLNVKREQAGQEKDPGLAGAMGALDYVLGAMDRLEAGQ